LEPEVVETVNVVDLLFASRYSRLDSTCLSISALESVSGHLKLVPPGGEDNEVAAVFRL
jgi:hypothetical protein